MAAKNKSEEKSDVDLPELMALHWKPNLERRGLGNLLVKANHIAITVSDVGRSLWFYSDVLGLQQIRRPNFDRHGAWLTMGNVELHLILGVPTVPEGGNLIVGHISLETSNIKEVLRRLKEMEVPFETNVSVPKGGDTSDTIVTQFFMKDPDGYYIELCNCNILTDFCLGDKKIHIEGYDEGISNEVSLMVMTKLAVFAERAKKRKTALEATRAETLEEFDQVDTTGVVVDETKLANLLKRTKIYGDTVQGETEESLREILQKTGNDVPKALIVIKAKHKDHQQFQPPVIYRNDEEAIKPEQLHIDHK